METPPPAVRRVPFRDALRFWVTLGFVNFGGPSGQIAIMHQELVERRRWLDEDRYLHALSFAMLLPGPEAHQLAIYVGWLLHGAPGAFAAGVFFLLPAFVLMVGLSWVYVVHGDVAWVAAILEGLSWAVVGIVAAALLRLSTRAVRNRLELAVAVVAFLALFVFGVPFPLVVLGAGAVGLMAHRPFPDVLPDRAVGPTSIDGERVRPTWRRATRVLAVGLLVWLGPLVLVVAVAGSDSVLAQEAVFFSVMALVTFGGAYAVLAYVNQAAVSRFGWLTSSEMAVGLSLAETTPGPLILSVVFVGFVAAYRSPGSLDPLAAAIAGALVTAWATFVPSFLWIFLGAPSVERLRGNARLSSGLAAITAAVVGVIADLGVVFAVSVLFDETDLLRAPGHDIVVPVIGSADVLALAVAVGAFVAMWRFRVNVVWIVLAAGVVGWARWVLG